MLLGTSLLPTSVAGFMQVKSLKDECRGTGSNEPCSLSVIDDDGSCNKLLIHSSVSADTRLISSSNILYPPVNWFFHEAERGDDKPSSGTNSFHERHWEANLPFPRTYWDSKCRTLRSKPSQASRCPSDSCACTLRRFLGWSLSVSVDCTLFPMQRRFNNKLETSR